MLAPEIRIRMSTSSMFKLGERLGKLVFGPTQTLRHATRAVLAFSALQDCSKQFPEAPGEELRTLSKVNRYALRSLYPARLANGPRRHRTRTALGGDARPGDLRRWQRLGFA